MAHEPVMTATWLASGTGSASPLKTRTISTVSGERQARGKTRSEGQTDRPWELSCKLKFDAVDSADAPRARDLHLGVRRSIRRLGMFSSS
jgi:hypothetical protein